MFAPEDDEGTPENILDSQVLCFFYNKNHGTVFRNLIVSFFWFSIFCGANRSPT
jgi:hypothetical protein